MIPEVIPKKCQTCGVAFRETIGQCPYCLGWCCISCFYKVHDGRKCMRDLE